MAGPGLSGAIAGNDMNYRHAFHAGNFADVVKHAALAMCFERLNAKDKPWRFIDTHAGVGRYDLTADEAVRSPEWRDGVARVWEAIGTARPEVVAAMDPYVRVLRAMNPGRHIQSYPGSPMLAAELMRADDAIRLCELHAPTRALLEEAMGRDRRVKIEERDGYEALPAYLPPPERRGLVLIDPPFEEGTSARKLDFERMALAARKAVRRWPGGTYVFWRPVKDVAAVRAFDADLAALLLEDAGLPSEKLIVADVWVRPVGPGPLSAAGVVIANPPFGVEDSLRIALPWLANLMDQTPDEAPDGAGWRLERPAPYRF